MNKEQEELLNEAYENYSKEYEKDNSIYFGYSWICDIPDIRRI